MVGRRLARWALADVYQKIELRGGPEFERAIKDGSSVLLEFSQTGNGLHIMDGSSLAGFEIAGSDRAFLPAIAEIRGKHTVVLSHESITEPYYVRYAWKDDPREANLTNKERLPAAPFESYRQSTISNG